MQMHSVVYLLFTLLNANISLSPNPQPSPESNMARRKKRQPMYMTPELRPVTTLIQNEDDDEATNQQQSCLPSEMTEPVVDPTLTPSKTMNRLVRLLKCKLLDSLYDQSTSLPDCTEIVDKSQNAYHEASASTSMNLLGAEKDLCQRFKLAASIGIMGYRLPKWRNKADYAQEECVRFLGCLVDLSAATGRIFHALPAPAGLPGGCPNTWLMQVTFSPDKSSEVAAETNAWTNTSMLPSCKSLHSVELQQSLSQLGMDASAVNTLNLESLVPFHIEISFTLWNEVLNIPVCYKGPQEQDKDNDDLVPIKFGAFLDFRMPLPLLCCPGQGPLDELNSVSTSPTASHHMIHAAEQNSLAFSSTTQCSPSCCAFSNELLLSINLGMQHIWTDGGDGHPFITSFHSQDPYEATNTEEKGKFKAMQRVYSDPNLQDLPPRGTFQPAKILLYDTMVKSIVENNMQTYQTSIMKYVRIRTRMLRKEAESGSGQEALGPFSSPIFAPSSTRKSKTEQDSSAKFTEERSHIQSRSPSKQHESEGNKPSGVHHSMAATLASIPAKKSFYDKTSVTNVSAQHLLVCSGCGTFGVNGIGALPWPVKRRCSQCKTTW